MKSKYPHICAYCFHLRDEHPDGTGVCSGKKPKIVHTYDGENCHRFCRVIIISKLFVNNSRTYKRQLELNH